MKADYEHTIVVINYEVSKMDTNHPDHADLLKNREIALKYATESVEELNKSITNIEKVLAEENEGITKIESGETKVCLESLNELVSEMIRQDALNQVTTA